MSTVYIVETHEWDGEGLAVFEHEDQAKDYADARGLMYFEAPVCSRRLGEEMISEAKRDG